MKRILISMILVFSLCMAVPVVNFAADTAVCSLREGDTRESGKLVIINSATLDELQALRGVGPVLARRIVEYREKNGPFGCVDDLLNVTGIGPSKLNLFRDLIQVETAK